MTIKIDEYTDPFTYHVYNQIPPNVRATFTPSQVTAIENAIRASRPFQKHPVDMRGTVPLYFFRLYFVLLMGRDKRTQTRNKEDMRKRKVAVGSAVLSLYVVISALTPILFLLLYMLKAAVGIDIFEGVHLEELLQLSANVGQQEISSAGVEGGS